MMWTQGQRQEFLELYGSLRVADVRDGMDWLGMHHYGSLSPDIRPLFRTRAVGIARTCRYLPFEGPVPKLTPDEYTQWSGWYYNNVCVYPWMNDIEPGDFIVIDQSHVNVGLMGSANALGGFNMGIRGYVTNGGVRDTDELILEQIPFWSRIVSQGMDQGRIQFDGKNVPVCVGGVTVRPGDIIVADGDGVIAVPQRLARDVAKYAMRELTNDKKDRKKMYEESGRELDDTVL